MELVLSIINELSLLFILSSSLELALAVALDILAYVLRISVVPLLPLCVKLVVVLFRLLVLEVLLFVEVLDAVLVVVVVVLVVLVVVVIHAVQLRTWGPEQVSQCSAQAPLHQPALTPPQPTWKTPGLQAPAHAHHAHDPEAALTSTPVLLLSAQIHPFRYVSLQRAPATSCSPTLCTRWGCRPYSPRRNQRRRRRTIQRCCPRSRCGSSPLCRRKGTSTPRTHLHCCPSRCRR